MQAFISRDPLVSVIIPHLNEPDDLRRCLRALDAQKADGFNFEIIVVDNGSRELPEEICAGVKLERELIPGPGPARNRGAEVARAEILAFIDADCIADDGWIRGIVEFFDAHRDVHCLGGDIRVAPTSSGPPTETEAYENIFSYQVQRYVKRDHFAATGNMAVRRRAFEAVGPFGGIAIREDNDWGLRATALGFRIAYVSQVRVFTPPCKSFAELARRWDRLVAHEFQEIGAHPSSRAKWLARSFAIAISPLAEVPSIIRSDRVTGFRECWLAWTCLTRIRLYRAQRMLDLIRRGDPTRIAEGWNRD
ncbi:glycosyltransferase (plasmid) [Microvirga ossetica]|uniref:Glycosyltransferase n=1 Tax=Microvirga ossetica TaxID=1882682 RepID=A0A1B2EQG0_9HYPH|nr:glycosyltransferase [Microvirga ossetica]ANY82189.1 glycosyltransferase [Microvirga ossetica]